MNYKIIIVISLFLLGVGVLLLSQLHNNQPFVPEDYEPPTIPKENIEQYKAEQEQLYDELNYTGARHYVVPINRNG